MAFNHFDSFPSYHHQDPFDYFRLNPFDALRHHSHLAPTASSSPPAPSPTFVHPTDILSPATPQPLASPKQEDPPQSPSAGPRKRPTRAAISTKDFVPPDVSGLSKREARLVKNRAAAFLSRQRKREEFESMEVRVAALEKENARLRALSSSGSSSPPPSPISDPELETLRAQLAESRAREEALEMELAQVRAAVPDRSPAVKCEPDDNLLGAAVLCALPSFDSNMDSYTGSTGSFPTLSLPLANDSFFAAQHRPSAEFDVHVLSQPACSAPGPLRMRVVPSAPPAFPTMPLAPVPDLSSCSSASSDGTSSPTLAPWDRDMDAFWPSPTDVKTPHASFLPASGSHRRVKIALRDGNVREGGQWDVEVL